jgi:hypothetical protein
MGIMKKKIPAEYHKVVDNLFSESVWASGKPPAAKAIDSFAGILGIAANYTRLKRSIMQEAKKPLSVKNSGDAYGGGLRLFLSRFQENFDLMIAKTWVEKDDEERKERLQWKIPNFVKQIEKGDYNGALTEFSGIIHELSYLLFGEQSKKDDFLDYTFRIDPPMGLFFWYGLHLDIFFGQKSEIVRDILLLGMCYLTDF